MLVPIFVLGTSVGNYVVTAKIGEGGMGAVYLAHHATIGRRAAVKVLLPELINNRELVARFINEARAASAIRHPSIVEIYDFGYLTDVSAYIVMEFLDGESLASRRQRLGMLDAPHALAVVRQIADALAAAHDAGIVHRDLKPDNVFLVRNPEVAGGERIKVLDFGIAKQTSVDASQTQTGSVLGTPTYMSPEQCRGSGTVDARADLYALGCVLFELVCGRPPFVVDGAGELIAHHLYFEPPAPRSVVASIPESCEQLILSLLRKDPGARPANARAVIELIDQMDIQLPGHTAGSLPGYPTAAAVVALPFGMASTLTPTTLSGATLGGTPARIRNQRWLIGAVATTIVAAGIAIVLAAARDAGRSPPSGISSKPLPVTRLSGASPLGASAAARAPSPSPPPPPPPSERVTLTIDSDPPGATVFVDGKQLGVTPFADHVVRGTARSYMLQMSGYRPARATLVGDRTSIQRIVLTKQ